MKIPCSRREFSSQRKLLSSVILQQNPGSYKLNDSLGQAHAVSSRQ